MLQEKQFRIMYNYQVFNRRQIIESDDFPKTIPFSKMEPLRKQIEINHGQTLERLTERGGLSTCEIYVASLGNGKISRTEEYTKINDIRGLIYIIDLLSNEVVNAPLGGTLL